MKGAIAYDQAVAVIHVQDRRKTKVDTVRTQFGGQDPTGFAGQLLGFFRMAIPNFTELAHGRNFGESFAKALHAPTFMIHSDQQGWRPHFMNAGGERL